MYITYVYKAHLLISLIEGSVSEVSEVSEASVSEVSEVSEGSVSEVIREV